MLDMYNANSTALLSHYIQGCIAKKVALSLLSRLFGKLVHTFNTPDNLLKFLSFLWKFEKEKKTHPRTAAQYYS